MNTAEQQAVTRHEYRMKGWYRSLLLCLGAPAAAGGVVIAYLSFKAGSAPLSLVMTAAFLAFGIYLIALATRSRFIVDRDHIEIRGAFTERSAEFGEIVGYRTISSRNGKYTQIYLRNGLRALTVSNTFEHDDAYDAWFRRIPNLDQRDRDELLEKISNEQSLGATPQDRLAALKDAKTSSIVALIVAAAAAIAANWGIPSLYVPFAVALALVPVGLGMILHRNPLLYTVFRKKDDPRAELLYALITCSFGLLVRARGIHFVSLQTVGIVIGVIAVVYLAAFYQALLESASMFRTFFALLLFALLYGYGAFVVADAVGDRSTSTRYVARVLDKNYTTGRSRSFYLVLEPWGPVQQPNKLGVTQTEYNKAEAGDRVCLDLRRGRLNVPWYSHVSCNAAGDDAQQ